MEYIKHKALEQGMITLRESCIELVKEGITTLDELIRMTYSLD